MANKQDLIAKVAEATELTKKDSAAAVDAVFASIEEFLAAGEKVLSQSQLLKFLHLKLVKLLKTQLNNVKTPKILGVLIYTK